MSEIFVIGHSHTNALKSALAKSSLEWQRKANVIHVLVASKQGGYTKVLDEDGSGQLRLNKYLRQLLTSGNASDGAPLVVSAIGGNAHNIFGLIEHPQPFDFILSENGPSGRLHEAELIPYDAMSDILNQYAAQNLNELTALRASVEGPIVHLESPPPIGDDDHVQNNLDPYFIEKNVKPPIAPRLLRYKLWRLHSDIVSRHCLKLGIPFIAAPAETMDREGFLLPEFYPSNNATHGNDLYGKLVLKQIFALHESSRS